jgi:hypothetical protein
MGQPVTPDAPTGNPAADASPGASDAAPSANVTPAAGGTVTSSDGRLTITVPPGAVTQAVDVRIAPVPAAEVPAGAFPAGIAYRLTPDGLQLAQPASATAAATLTPGAPGQAGSDLADRDRRPRHRHPDRRAERDELRPVTTS